MHCFGRPKKNHCRSLPTACARRVSATPQLGLLAEVRLNIYKYLIPDIFPLAWHKWTNRFLTFGPDKKRRELCIASTRLASVCYLLRSEIAPILAPSYVIRADKWDEPFKPYKKAPQSFRHIQHMFVRDHRDIFKVEAVMEVSGCSGHFLNSGASPSA
jgi:hypothetical protein